MTEPEDLPDEALVTWATATPEGYVPFYRMLYYPDVLDLKKICLLYTSDAADE